MKIICYAEKRARSGASPLDPRPLVVAIADRDRARRRIVSAIVRGLHARVTRHADDAGAVVVLRAPDAKTRSSGVPILTYGAPAARSWRPELPMPDDVTAFGAALAPWLDRGEALNGTVKQFGDAAIGPMAARLAEELERFLVAPALDPFEAHRLGGFAGTLGFRRLAHCAERLSQDPAAFTAAARREAGWAIAALNDYLRRRADRSAAD
ncbi:hypothetical protein [Sphingomonas spermidinifaciens]|nr:hypothetical protein [Sphingomonas spermidinifaciens]